jgi:hypothetical protein
MFVQEFTTMLFGTERVMHPLLLVQIFVRHSTVTVKLLLTRLLQLSVAVQFTVVVVPGAKELPESGLHVTVTLVQQVSVAVGV